MKPKNKRYWISWWSTYMLKADADIGYKAWITGYKNVLADVPDTSYVAVIDAPSEEAAWEMVKKTFPDYEERFCTEKEPDFYPPVDRFP